MKRSYKSVTLYLETNEHKESVALARRKDTSLSAMVRGLLRKCLRSNGIKI